MALRSVYFMDDIPEARASSGKFQFDMRRALIPISLAVFFVLYFYFRVPWWGLMALTLWIPVYYLGSPMYTRYRWKHFDKEFNYRFPQQDYKGLLLLYKSQWFLRQFGPKALMLEKLGLIYSAMGHFRDAERILEGAIRQADRRDQSTRQKLMLNLAHTKYELGKYDEALQFYQILIKRIPHLPGAQTRISMINVHLGHNLQRSLDHLQEELPYTSGEEKERVLEAITSAESQLKS